MRRKSFWIGFLLSACFPLLIAAAQETPSLGELARQARNQRKTSGESRTQTVESPGVGVRLVIPLDWKATDNRGGPFGNQLSIDCNPEHPGVCTIFVKSEALPRDKRAITDADLEEWKSQDPPAGFRRVAGRDWQVARRPAHEAIFENPDGWRRRLVNILARDGGRLYKFECSAYWFSKDRLEEYAPAMDKVLESLSPVGQPTPEEVETAEIVSRFSAEERTGSRNVFNILLMELMCKAMIQKYVPLDQVLNGCSARTEKEGGAISFSVSLPEDPRRDPNYEYRVVARADAFELSAAPKRKGLGGFFWDGQRIYYNPQGAASVSDKKIYEFKVPPAESASSAQPVVAPPAGPPAQPAKKKVWTEEDLAGLRGPINVGGGEAASKPESPAATTPSAGSSRRQALRERGFIDRKELRAEERRAEEYLVTIAELENKYCKPNLQRFCSLDELVQGVEVEPGRTVGFRAGMEPSSDPNYEYRVTLQHSSYEVSATPRRPGLGGLMYDRGVAVIPRYNPEGSATEEDPRVMGPVGYGHLIRER